MIVLETNLACTRIVLLCNTYFHFRNNSNVFYTCFTMQCLFFHQKEIQHTLYFLYLAMLIFKLKGNVVCARFVFPYNACVCVRNKCSIPIMCLFVLEIVLVSTNFFTLQWLCLCYKQIQLWYIQLDLFYLAISIFMLETNLGSTRFYLPYKACVCVRNKSNHTRFVVSCKYFVYDKRKSNARYISLTLKCLFVLLFYPAMTLFLFYITLDMFYLMMLMSML